MAPSTVLRDRSYENLDLTLSLSREDDGRFALETWDYATTALRGRRTYVDRERALVAFSRRVAQIEGRVGDADALMRVRVLEDKVICHDEYGEGETGVITHWARDLVEIKLDRKVSLLNEWDNCLLYSIDDFQTWDGKDAECRDVRKHVALIVERV
jgi:hypothetical protein